MSKYLPSILAMIAAIMPTVSGDVAAAVSVFVEHNPQLTGWLVSAVWIAYNLLPSPMQAQITAKQMPPLPAVTNVNNQAKP
jgi:hypothetical protein